MFYPNIYIYILRSIDINIQKPSMTTFIETYYATDSTVASDTELQSWFAEAQGAAGVLDFPCSPNECGKRDLMEILTHFAYLTGVAYVHTYILFSLPTHHMYTASLTEITRHHALNTGDPVVSLGTLPFHPMALVRITSHPFFLFSLLQFSSHESMTI